MQCKIVSCCVETTPRYLWWTCRKNIKCKHLIIPHFLCSNGISPHIVLSFDFDIFSWSGVKTRWTNAIQHFSFWFTCWQQLFCRFNKLVLQISKFSFFNYCAFLFILLEKKPINIQNFPTPEIAPIVSSCKAFFLPYYSLSLPPNNNFQVILQQNLIFS